MKKFFFPLFLLLVPYSIAQQQEEIITFNIIHSPITSALVYEPVEIRATIVPSHKVAYASLNYRIEGETAYTVVFMKNIGADTFVGEIPGDQVIPPAIEYFIFAMDIKGIPHIIFRDPKNPQRITVTEEKLPEEPVAGAELEKEFALFAAEEVVVAAAKREQKISEAPAAITVLTEDDIRSAGVVSLVDVFRLVPGMEVYYINPSDPIFNARGFGTEKNNRMLVLVDGRVLANEFFGKNFIEAMPVPIEDIKRIEVIRGPGSSLYGANAYSGIISIITKKPEEFHNVYESSVIAGTSSVDYLKYPFGTSIYTIRGGTKLEKAGFVYSAGYKQLNDLLHPDFKIHSIERGRFRLTYEPFEKAEASFEAGLSRTEGNTFATLGTFHYNFDDTYAHARYDWKDLKTSFYWKRSYTEIPLVINLFGLRDLNLLGENFTGLSNSYDFEVQHSAKIGEINRVTYGGNFRYNTYSSPIILKEVDVPVEGGTKHFRLDREVLGGVFVQDEFRPLDELILTADVRFDKFSITPYAISPRVNVTYIPFSRHAFRTAYGRAFRKPIYMEAQMIPKEIPYDLDVLLQMESNIFIGNPLAKNEEIETVEFGYRGQVLDNLRVTVDTYYNELRNFINFTITTQPSFNLQYLNEERQFYGRGGEIAVEYYPVKEIKMLLNYFLLNKRDELDRDELVTQNITGMNMGLFGKYEGLNGALLVHARGPFYRMLTDPDDPLNQKLYRLSGYTLVNLNLSYEIIKEHLICGFFVFNLFNQIHREFEGTEIYDKSTYEAISNGGEEIGQRFFLFVNGKI